MITVGQFDWQFFDVYIYFLDAWTLAISQCDLHGACNDRSVQGNIRFSVCMTSWSSIALDSRPHGDHLQYNRSTWLHRSSQCASCHQQLHTRPLLSWGCCMYSHWLLWTLQLMQYLFIGCDHVYSDHQRCRKIDNWQLSTVSCQSGVTLYIIAVNQ